MVLRHIKSSASSVEHLHDVTQLEACVYEGAGLVVGGGERGAAAARRARRGGRGVGADGPPHAR